MRLVTVRGAMARVARYLVKLSLPIFVWGSRGRGFESRRPGCVNESLATT
jgi:hypothetical protein